MDSLDSAGPRATHLDAPSPEKAFETLCIALQRSGLELKSAQLAVGFFALPEAPRPGRAANQLGQIQEAQAAWLSGELLPSVRVVHDRGLISEVPLYLDWHLRDRTGQGLDGTPEDKLLASIEAAGLRGMNHQDSEARHGPTFSFAETPRAGTTDRELIFISPNAERGLHPELKSALHSQPELIQQWRGYQGRRLKELSWAADFIRAQERVAHTEQRHERHEELKSGLSLCTHGGPALALGLLVAAMPTLGAGPNYPGFFLLTVVTMTMGFGAVTVAYLNDLTTNSRWVLAGVLAMLTSFIALISGLFQVVALNDTGALTTWQVLSLMLITPLSLLRHTTFEGVLRYLATALFAGLIMQVLGLITGGFMNGAATLLGIMTVLGLVLAGLIRRSARTGTSDPREAERELIGTLVRQLLLPKADLQELQVLHAALQRQFEARQSEARQSDVKQPEISDRAKNTLIARSCSNAQVAIKIEQNEGPWASRQFERAVIRWRREPTASAWSGTKASSQARKIRPTPLTAASPESAESTNPAPRAIHAAQLRRMALISELAPTTTLDVIPEPAPLASARKA